MTTPDSTYGPVASSDGIARHAGTRRIIVQRVPIYRFVRPWGFTIWEFGRCVAGECDDRWSATQARAAADRALAAIEAMDGAGDAEGG